MFRILVPPEKSLLDEILLSKFGAYRAIQPLRLGSNAVACCDMELSQLIWKYQSQLSQQLVHFFLFYILVIIALVLDKMPELDTAMAAKSREDC